MCLNVYGLHIDVISRRCQRGLHGGFTDQCWSICLIAKVSFDANGDRQGSYLLENMEPDGEIRVAGTFHVSTGELNLLSASARKLWDCGFCFKNQNSRATIGFGSCFLSMPFLSRAYPFGFGQDKWWTRMDWLSDIYQETPRTSIYMVHAP